MEDFRTAVLWLGQPKRAVTILVLQTTIVLVSQDDRSNDVDHNGVARLSYVLQKSRDSTHSTKSKPRAAFMRPFTNWTTTRPLEFFMADAGSSMAGDGLF